MKILVNSHFYSNFSCGPLVWMFSSAKSPYDTPLAKSGKVTMKASRLRSHCIEIYKSINSVNINRVTNRMVHSQYRPNINIPKVSQVSFTRFKLGMKSSFAKISDQSKDKACSKWKNFWVLQSIDLKRLLIQRLQCTSIYLLSAYKNEVISQFDYVLINLSR